MSFTPLAYEASALITILTRQVTVTGVKFCGQQSKPNHGNLASFVRDHAIENTHFVLYISSTMFYRCEGQLKEAEERIRDTATDSILAIRRREKEMVTNLYDTFGEEGINFIKEKHMLQVDSFFISQAREIPSKCLNIEAQQS